MKIRRKLDATAKTEKWFQRHLRGLLKQFEAQLALDSTLLARNTDVSKEDYEEYGAREMQEYEQDSCQAMKDGVVLDLSLREIREAYLAPVVSAIEDLSTGLTRPLRVLEVGCGNGTNLMLLNEQFDGTASFHGIDIAEGRIREGHAYWKERLHGVELQAASATDLSVFEDKQFDLVYSICALEQITYRLHEAVSEMVRLADQRIVCVEPVYHFGNPTQRLYLIVNDHCRTLLPEMLEQCTSVEEHGLMPVLHNPLSPVGLLVAKP